jgi:hypothetical protein
MFAAQMEGYPDAIPSVRHLFSDRKAPEMEIFWNFL